MGDQGWSRVKRRDLRTGHQEVYLNFKKCIKDSYPMLEDLAAENQVCLCVKACVRVCAFVSECVRE